MAVSAENYDRVCAISPEGDFAGENVEQARRIVNERIEGGENVHFVIDFEKCEFIDSEGLEMLLWAKRCCESVKGQLRLAGLNETCAKILEMTRLDHRFERQDELAGAVKMMR